MRATLLLLSLLVTGALLVTGTALAGDDFPYVFKRGTDSVARIHGTLDSFQRIANRFKGEYIWVERGGREYLIRDEAVLAEGDRAFAPVRALEPQMRAAEARLRPLEEKADRLSDDEENDHEAELAKLRPIVEAAEREVERLDDEIERREAVAEKNFEQVVLRAIKAGKALRVD